MGSDGLQRRTRVDLVRGILVVGLGSALAVYFTASGAAPDPLGDPLANSKVYRRSLELYGGKANVLVAELMAWFNGLWHGKSLAYTMASITAVISGALLYIGYHWPPDQQTQESGHDERT